MNKKGKIVFFAIVTVVWIFAIFYAKYRDPAYTNIDLATTELKVSSEDLVSLFLNNEKLATDTYAGKIIEIDGIVKDITFLNNRNTVLLSSKVWSSNVICDMRIDQVKIVEQLKVGQKIKIKGVCKGFLKDAVILNCKLINE
ncbi:hypothetical protein D1816_12230 [Aquimarina sp. AD10]|uniref:tRNA_anti-like n=1 Tax=Aquimarina aggregata TaxID=1642818 RepID=A0A162YK26_9FLAO|nr:MULTISPECIES: hypothetical protein [Aquimarina]AXT61084.1 hypothetical protein D1816_12230 [Aquimarina sp. AD10]KZS39182.1 hypothetical protein AWE51_11540 [Aquimarina aggregata]RKM92741.1 hypothetical protein D7033_20535 [Aquimarina sp. AD10]